MGEIQLRISKQGLFDLQKGLSALRTSLLRNGAVMVEEIGQIYVERVTSLMGAVHQGGPYGWAPLSDVWLQLKRDNSWTREIWEATGETKRGVAVQRSRVVPRGVAAFSGVEGTETKPGVNASLVTRAVQTEYGLKGDPNLNWPARPLFKPEALRIVEEVKAAGAGSYGTDVGRSIRRNLLIAAREAQGV